MPGQPIPLDDGERNRRKPWTSGTPLGSTIQHLVLGYCVVLLHYNLNSPTGWTNPTLSSIVLRHGNPSSDRSDRIFNTYLIRFPLLNSPNQYTHIPTYHSSLFIHSSAAAAATTCHSTVLVPLAVRYSRFLLCVVDKGGTQGTEKLLKAIFRDGMAGLTPLSSSPADLAGTNSPPKVDEFEYLHEVFGITTADATATEAEIEKSLTEKAASLGIDVSNLTDRLEHPTSTLNATSSRSSTLVAAHQRSDAMCSTDSTTEGTETTTGTDNDSAAIPAILTQSTSRKRSNTVNFSQYEKYLTQLEPALHQPKFSNPAVPTRRPSHNIFGFGHFKGVRELRRGLTGRLKRRKTHPVLSVV